MILSENKIERLKKIIIEAVEQSGRNNLSDLVILDKKMDFKIENGLNIYFHTVKNESIYLKDLDISNEKNINIFV
jgi:16S rRNA U1498 N3-methylase RsmE